VSLSVIRVIRASLTNPTTTNQIYYLITTVMFIIGAGDGKTNSKIVGRTGDRNPALLLEVSDLTNHTHALRESTSEACMGNDSKRGEERKGAGNMHDLETWCDGGGDNTTAPCSKSPKPTDTRTDLFMHIPLSLRPCLHLLSIPVASQLRFLSRTQTHAQLMHRQAFNVFWRMSILRNV